MTYQIDQSGKIEDTAKSTYVALANGKTLIIKISAKEKRKLIKIIKEFHRPNKTYIYQIFAVLIFVLLKESKVHEVTIDIEYFGHEVSIKEVLIQLFERFKKEIPYINFELVGKISNAHVAAIESFRKKREVDITISAKEVLELLYDKY